MLFSRFDLVPVLGIGALAISFGTLVVLSLTRFDLMPGAALRSQKTWLLTVAIGSGVIAFTIKMILVVTVASMPAEVVQDTKRPIGKTPTMHRSEKPARRANYLLLPINPENIAGPAALQSNSLRPYSWSLLPDPQYYLREFALSEKKVALGETLFNDQRLSADGSVSCASCHDVYGKAGADGRATSVGVGGQLGHRNAPSVWNTAFQSVFFWDGRAPSLEEQAKGPFINPVEMGMNSLQDVVDIIRSDSIYRQKFAEVYGTDSSITIDYVVDAIASYERTLVSSDSAYDRFVAGDSAALDESQIRGMSLFASIGCTSCHSGPNFSSASTLQPGSPWRIFPAYPSPLEIEYDLLLASKNGNTYRGAWRVPSLRNVALTGPWLHNGSINTLEEVVQIMAAAQLGRAGHFLLWSYSSKTFQTFGNNPLSDQEVTDLVNFLHALSSERLM